MNEPDHVHWNGPPPPPAAFSRRPAGQPQGLICPGCEQPAAAALGEQAFCGNGDCHVMAWNPSKTLEEMSADIGRIAAEGYCSTYCQHNRNGQCDCDPCAFLRANGPVEHYARCPLNAEGNQ